MAAAVAWIGEKRQGWRYKLLGHAKPERWVSRFFDVNSKDRRTVRSGDLRRAQVFAQQGIVDDHRAAGTLADQVVAQQSIDGGADLRHGRDLSCTEPRD